MLGEENRTRDGDEKPLETFLKNKKQTILFPTFEMFS